MRRSRAVADGASSGCATRQPGVTRRGRDRARRLHRRSGRRDGGARRRIDWPTGSGSAARTAPAAAVALAPAGTAAGGGHDVALRLSRGQGRRRTRRRYPGALDGVCRAVAAAGRAASHRGGARAEARSPTQCGEFDARIGLSADAAHWMAILAMDQYAHVLAERIRGAVLVEEPGGAAPRRYAAGGVAVLAPSRWMRSADVLPHSWEVDQRQHRGVRGGALDAERLILIKPVGGGSRIWSTRTLRPRCPAGMPCSMVGWDRLDELAARLSELASGGVRRGGCSVRRALAGKVLLEALGRHRPAEEVALHLVTALLPQQIRCASVSTPSAIT